MRAVPEIEGSPSVPDLEFYLPPEGLQGQEIPGHVLWQPGTVTRMWFEFSQTLRVQAVFNSSAEDFDIADGRLTVRRVKRDGYLGFVFQSDRSVDLSRNDSVRLHVVGTDGSTRHYDQSISMFRSILSVAPSPREITIDAGGRPSDRLYLSHVGQGTLLVSVEPDETSTLTLTIPEDLQKAFVEFAEDFSTRLKVIRSSYPQFDEFFKTAAEVDFRKRDEALNALAEVEKRLALTNEFKEEVANAFLAAFVRSSDMEMAFFRPIADFIKSAVARGIIFTTPFLEIPPSSDASLLVLKIQALDVLRHRVTVHRTPAIVIKNLSAGAVPIGDLISWTTKDVEEP